MIGYKYNTIEEFEVDNKIINDYFGIPKTPTSTTRNYLSYSISYTLTNEIDFYYIGMDLTDILGTPTEFEVIEQEIII